MSSLTDQSATGSDRERAAVRIEQLYASHCALVRSVCRSVLRDGWEAEDAVQRTFLAAQRALVNGSSPRDPAAWLATIARHESLARVRARMREPLPLDAASEVAGPDAYAAAVRREEVGELRDAIAELPAQQREAVLLREVRGFSYQEVASTLSVTTATVESLLFRARRTLQARLRDSLAAFSPMELLRELAGRLGGGYVTTAAAKALVVGAGAAMVTGGAIVGPRIVGLGHAPTKPSISGARRVERASHARMAQDTARQSTQVRFAAVANPSHPLVRKELGQDSSGRDVASPDPAGSGGGGDSASRSDGANSRSNDGAETNGGGTPDSNSQTPSESTTETTTTSSGSSGSGGSDGTSGSDGSGGTTTTGSPDGG